MIKRRYYKSEHGDGNEASSASSSSSSESDSESEAESTKGPGSSSPGYESEESSVAEEFSADSIDEDDSAGNLMEESSLSSANMHVAKSLEKMLKGATNHEAIAADLPSHVLKLKSVYRCMICPKVICLNEKTMLAHVNSKKHARSEKLLKENKLREMLNDHGEIENQETAAELHARVVALAEEKPKFKKQRHRRDSTVKEKPKFKKERRKASSMSEEVGNHSNKKRKIDGSKSNPIRRKQKKNGS